MFSTDKSLEQSIIKNAFFSAYLAARIDARMHCNTKFDDNYELIWKRINLYIDEVYKGEYEDGLLSSSESLHNRD